jgi:hypothetical protein
VAFRILITLRQTSQRPRLHRVPQEANNDGAIPSTPWQDATGS